MSAQAEAQATRMRGAEGLDASQYAPGGKIHDRDRKNQSQDKEALFSLLELSKDITTIKRGLEDEGIESEWLKTLGELATRVSYASRNENAPTGSMERRLKGIEETLRRAFPLSGSPTDKNTWAAVTANGMRGAYTSQAESARNKPERHTVRVTMPNAKDQNEESILQTVKKAIPSAAAIRVLQSGDVDVTVPTEAAKEKAQGVQPTPELKVHRQDYMIELLGVPLSTKVALGKHADNGRLATAICEASGTLAPGLSVTRIQWLYSQAQLERLQKAGKQRGSLLIGFQSQEMRRRAIQSGLVMGAQLYEARHFDRATQEVQCYKCQQWGHTQHACAKQARCARCAGQHDSKNCTKETGRFSCANCGKEHQAWQRRDCRAYQTYHDLVQRRRVDAIQQTRIARAACVPPATQLDGWTQITRKRQREDSPNEAPRRIGRPTNIERAARAASQRRIGFAGASQTLSPQASSTEITMNDE